MEVVMSSRFSYPHPKTQQTEKTNWVLHAIHGLRRCDTFSVSYSTSILLFLKTGGSLPSKHIFSHQKPSKLKEVPVVHSRGLIVGKHICLVSMSSMCFTEGLAAAAFFQKGWATTYVECFVDPK